MQLPDNIYSLILRHYSSRICKVLRDHKEALKDDTERLSGEFIVRMSQKVHREAETGDGCGGSAEEATSTAQAENARNKTFQDVMKCISNGAGTARTCTQ